MRSIAAARAWRAGQGGTVVFTNGVFDLLHPGHVAVLEAARAAGDALIVGVNDDASVRTLDKGPERPIVPVEARMRLLAALACVDCVVPFADPTPRDLIAALEPDVLVKGGDYDPSTVVGGDLVRARGGRVLIVPLVPDLSTTRLVERLRASS